MDAGSGDVVAKSADGGSGEVSERALAGIIIMGLIGTFLAIVVVLLTVYIRYGPLRRTQHDERSPLIK